MIVYATRTGNVRYVAHELMKLDNHIQILDMKEVSDIKEPFLLFTYTDLLGKAPAMVLDFLRRHHTYCKGVIASGNTNFGKINFGGAADVIEHEFGIPALHKIDLRGNQSDYHLILQLHRERVQHEREHVLEVK